MQICHTIPEVRATCAALRQGGAPLALVPTTGALHAGHLALVDRARAEAGRVIVSIFANRAPFGPNEAFSTPPQDLEHDLAKLRGAGADVVFLPQAGEIYPEGAQTIVETPDLARMLLGKSRPGHFRGVATMATKLFNIVQPDVACYGETHFQQICVIRRLARDLHLPLRIIGAPVLREADGLALARRNARLTPAERTAATVLNRTLDAAQDMATTGITASRLRAWVAARLQREPRAELQSADIRDARTLDPVSGALTAPAVILLAARFGVVLLTDQRVVSP